MIILQHNIDLNKFTYPSENVVRVFAIEQDSNERENFRVYMKDLSAVNISKNPEEKGFENLLLSSV